MDVTLTRIRHNIPEEILEVAFATEEDNLLERGQIPLLEKIKKTVIRDRLMVDCNLFGGTSTKIPLVLEYHERTAGFWKGGVYTSPLYCIYRIPPEARNGLPIVAVNGLSLNPGTGNFSSGWGGASISGIGGEILSSRTFANEPVYPIPKLLAGDLIKLQPGQMSHMDFVLSCKLSHDPDFSNMGASAINVFAELALCAVKAYIYNKLKIKIDKAFISGGSEITSFKEIVDGYAEENTRYLELLDEYFGASCLEHETLMSLALFMV